MNKILLFLFLNLKLIHKRKMFYLINEKTGYRLEYDNSWVPLNETEKIDERKALIQQVMNKTLAITDALS
jgi:hypothetical protein